MIQKPDRPISPHLGVYERGPHMMASIFHRISGFILASAGLILLLCWIGAIAGGEESYAAFKLFAVDAGEKGTAAQQIANWVFRVVALGVVWGFFQHLFSGLRHLIMDMGAGYELKSNRTWSIAVFLAALLATAATALYVVARFLEI